MEKLTISESLYTNSKNTFKSKYFDFQIAHRYLFKLKDGNTIESTAYQQYLQKKPVVLAIDLTTMVGCPMRCKFCESSSIVYERNLDLDEIIDQVNFLLPRHDIDNFPMIMCSFHGIGEPSLIPDNIIQSSKILKNISKRIHIGIATIAAKIESIKQWRNCDVGFFDLQISSAGSTDKQRIIIMPNAPMLSELITEIKLCEYSSNFEQIKYNYILIKDFNDSDEDLLRLVSHFRGSSVMIKISYLNPTNTSMKSALTNSSFQEAEIFCEKIKAQGIDSYVYGAFAPIGVSCGQLVFNYGAQD